MPKAKRKQLNIGITPDQYEAVAHSGRGGGADDYGLLPSGDHGKGSAGAGAARRGHAARLADSLPAIHQQGGRHGPLCELSSGVLGGFAMQRVAAVAGCRDCLELVAEGLDDDKYMSHSLEVLYDGIRDDGIPSGPADIVPTTPERGTGLRAGLGNQPASA